MNRGGGYSARGRGRQSWRTVTGDFPTDLQTPVQTDEAFNGRISGTSDRKSHSSWRALGRGSDGSVSQDHQNATPAGLQSREKGTPIYGGQSYSRGGRSKQWKTYSKASSTSEFSHDKQFGSTSVEGKVNLDRSLMGSVDHLPVIPRLSVDVAVGSSNAEARVSESTEGDYDHVNAVDSECSTSLEQFDICPPKSGSVVLKPSLLSKNREKRNEMKRSVDGPKGIILRSGMVLLKSYLSNSEQVNIVRTCRTCGLGPAGFYQPRFRDGGKLHLKMMCFGEFWDPESSKYGDLRPIDGAKPPLVPQEFLRLVDRAIKDSRAIIAEDFRIQNVENILPSVKPDICLVNYYATTGRLGLHQDKDEGRESLGKGIPIVSFSIGDSAEFLYGDERDPEKADKVILESGDVLIFGGKSRHIFHGVSAIRPDTAPKSLLQETNLLPGRLNLTFRQHF